MGERDGLAGFNFLVLQRPLSPAGLGLFHTLSSVLHSQSFGFMMLGLGDIILPGIFINFLRRFDHMKGYKWFPSGYTTFGLVGCSYSALQPASFHASNLFLMFLTPASILSTVVDIVGLLLTFVALILLQRGQPALLYLVPCILIPTILAAWKFGDLSEMWKGFELSQTSVSVGATAAPEQEQEEEDQHQEDTASSSLDPQGS